MKRGFTLIELLVVVGLMGMLGVAATAGYAALQRGMEERGAVAAVNALLKAAKERAMVDRVPTKVFCFNRLIREADEVNNAIVVGEAVAVRRAGRISFMRSGKLFDEFADWGRTYDVLSTGEKISDRLGLRLWYFSDKEDSDLQYSIVADAVVSDTIDAYSFDGNSNMVMKTHVFYVKSDHGSPGWKIGSAYGFEFASIQLPHQFSFSNGSIPANLKSVEKAKVLYFDPESDRDKTVDIYLCQPDATGKPNPTRKAGTATSKENDKS